MKALSLKQLGALIDKPYQRPLTAEELAALRDKRIPVGNKNG